MPGYARQEQGRVPGFEELPQVVDVQGCPRPALLNTVQRPCPARRARNRTKGRQTATHKTQNCNCENPTEPTVDLNRQVHPPGHKQHKEKQITRQQTKKIRKQNTKPPFTKRPKTSTARNRAMSTVSSSEICSRRRDAEPRPAGRRGLGSFRGLSSIWVAAYAALTPSTRHRTE